MTGLCEMIVDGYSWRYKIGFRVTASAERRPAFAVSVHDVAVEAVSLHGPLPTGFAAVPALTIGSVRPCPNSRPPPDADDRVTVLPVLDATRSEGARPEFLY